MLVKTSFLLLALSIIFCTHLHAQTPYLENNKLQMTSATLNLRITQKKHVPVILNIGTEGKIKGSVQIGIMTERKDSDLLQKLKDISKSKEIVIYCGCCTLENCENVEKAFNILKKSGYSNVKALNLGEGFGPGWSGKGYPVDN